MANVIASSRNNPPFAGEDGNASSWTGYYKQSATVAGNIGDTIELLELPAGAKIDTVAEVHTAHGGTATVALGWKYKDGSAGGGAALFKAATTSVSAGNSSITILPEGVIAGCVLDKPAIVYATNAGSAIPTSGEIYVKLSGEYVGTK